MNHIPEILPMSTRAGHKLHIHVFRPTIAVPSAKTVVLYHGGGWAAGGPGQFYPLARCLAESGHTVLCPEYRLSQKHGTCADDSVADALHGWAWIVTRRKELALPHGGMVVGGSSAGGHLALCCAIPGLKAAECGEHPGPDALLLFNPVVDTSPSGYGNERFQNDPLRFSPLHLPPPQCPALIMHGERDALIPLSAVQAYAARLPDAQFLAVPDQEHGFIYDLHQQAQPWRACVRQIMCFLTNIN